MNDYFDGKTSFKVLTLYMGKNGVYDFYNVSNLKIVKASGDEDDLTANGKYLSFDYVSRDCISQATGKITHVIFDCFVVFGISYEV